MENMNNSISRIHVRKSSHYLSLRRRRGKPDLQPGVGGQQLHPVQAVLHRVNPLAVQGVAPGLLHHLRQVGVLLPQLVFQHCVAGQRSWGPSMFYCYPGCFNRLFKYLNLPLDSDIMPCDPAIQVIILPSPVPEVVTESPDIEECLGWYDHNPAKIARVGQSVLPPRHGDGEMQHLLELHQLWWLDYDR